MGQRYDERTGQWVDDDDADMGDMSFSLGEIDDYNNFGPEAAPQRVGKVRLPGEISEGPRVPDRDLSSNAETQLIDDMVDERGGGDLGVVDGSPDWDATDLAEARRLDAGGEAQASPWANKGVLPVNTPVDETWGGNAESPYLQQEAMRAKYAPRPAEPMEARELPADPYSAPPPPPGPLPPAPGRGPSMLPHGPTTALNSSADPAAGALNQQGVNLDDPDPIRAAWAKRRELAASQPSAPPRPEPEYQPYSSGGHRQSPEDLQRMWRSARLFGGAAEADNRLQMGLAMNAQVDKADAAGEASNYKRWIADQKARLGNQPLSEAGQEMLIAARMASPEGALTGTRADQDALRSIGAAGVRDKAIDAGTKKTVVTERSKDARQTRDQDFRGQNAALDDETKRRGQDINAENVRVQQAGRQADPAAEREAKLVGISRAGDVGRREAEDILDSGDYSHLSPSAQARVERALGTVDAQGGDKKGIARYAAAIGGGDARTQESVERKVLDPGTHTERLKLRDEIAQTRQSVHEAKSGFETLAKNPMALRAFTNIGVAGASKIGSITSIDGAMDFVRNAAKSGTQFAMSEEEQIAAAKIVRMLAKTAFSQGGKNLTQHELGLFGAGSGVDLGAGVGILKTPQMLQQYLQSIAKAYVTRKKNIGKEYKGLEGDL